MRSVLERCFAFARLETNWKPEILAGFTTFVTMAYIIFVNPSILSETGMPFAAVTAATLLGVTDTARGSLLEFLLAELFRARLPYIQYPVRNDVFQTLRDTARPFDFNQLHPSFCPQPEVRPLVRRRLIAPRRRDIDVLV